MTVEQLCGTFRLVSSGHEWGSYFITAAVGIQCAYICEALLFFFFFSPAFTFSFPFCPSTTFFFPLLLRAWKGDKTAFPYSFT